MNRTRLVTIAAAYALHVVDAGAHYAPDNWLERRASRPARGFNGVLAR